MFKKLINKLTKESGPVVPEVNRLTIGRAAIIDELALKLLPQDCVMEFPSDTYAIVAQGKADMGEGVHLHRFYPNDDSVLIQVLGGDGFKTTFVQEITLFNVVECYYPSADSNWDDWKDKIRQTSFQLPEDGPRYERAWFDNSDSPEDPVSFWETVYDDRMVDSGKRIYQTCMLYVRHVGEIDEFLLINMEEPDGGDRCVSILAGMPLSSNQISTS